MGSAPQPRGSRPWGGCVTKPKWRRKGFKSRTITSQNKTKTSLVPLAPGHLAERLHINNICNSRWWTHSPVSEALLDACDNKVCTLAMTSFRTDANHVASVSRVANPISVICKERPAGVPLRHTCSHQSLHRRLFPIWALCTKSIYFLYPEDVRSAPVEVFTKHSDTTWNIA